MRLDELRRKVAESQPGDWAVVPQGPLYLPVLGQVTGCDGSSLEVDYHLYLATCAAEVDLRLAWGLTADKDLDYSRYITLPDTTVSRVYVDAFWRGALVTRWKVISVDGARCYLPDPNSEYVRTGPSVFSAQIYAQTAPASEVALARLVQLLTDPDDSYGFDGYLERSGIVVTPDP